LSILAALQRKKEGQKMCGSATDLIFSKRRQPLFLWLKATIFPHCFIIHLKRFPCATFGAFLFWCFPHTFPLLFWAVRREQNPPKNPPFQPIKTSLLGTLLKQSCCFRSNKRGAKRAARSAGQIFLVCSESAPKPPIRKNRNKHNTPRLPPHQQPPPNSPKQQ